MIDDGSLILLHGTRETALYSVQTSFFGIGVLWRDEE